MLRVDGREYNELRPVKITRNYLRNCEGSCLIEMGNTKVICAVTVDHNVPAFLQDQGKGWITAEYCMMPRSSQFRVSRESSSGKPRGRTHEIQRLIARALRGIVNLKAIGERTLWVDCDVLQADGGTRTASITGAFVALVDAMQWMYEKGHIHKSFIKEFMAAVSVGASEDQVLLDLCYLEDSSASTDMNVVMGESGRYIEIQGTAEEEPFTKEERDKMFELAEEGIKTLINLQKEALGVQSIEDILS